MKNIQQKSINGFEDLEVFKKSYRISLEIHRLSLDFPKHEQLRGLADQIRRASKGICANIAEGYVSKVSQKQNLSDFYQWLLVQQMKCEYG